MDFVFKKNVSWGNTALENYDELLCLGIVQSMYV